MIRLALWATLMLVGCKDKAEEDTGEGELIDASGDGDDGECGGTPSVITSVTCTPTIGDVGDQLDQPILRFDVVATDEDGDLDAYRLSLYLDETIDGVVLPEGSPYGPSTGTTDGGECTTTEVNLGLRAGIPGTFPALETRYEWGLVLTDAGGVDSAIYTVACTTPDASGMGDPMTEPTGG